MQTKDFYHPLNGNSRILISYLTGTGCTELVARSFLDAFSRITSSVEIRRIQGSEDLIAIDLLVICFPVHAANAPKPVMNWAKELPEIQSIPTVVISVSGGGTVTPNHACRLPLIRTLGRKGFQVVYEDMVVMPSNWIVPTSMPVAATLIRTLPQKVAQVTEQLVNGVRKKFHPGPFNRLLTLLGNLESVGARRFGRSIRIAENCTSCSLCEQSCPVGNIQMVSNLPRFGSECIMCLSCIYGCPVNTLRPTFMKSVVIEAGFDLQAIKRENPIDNRQEIKNLTKGFLWLGVRRYLLDLDYPL
jgi:ferredoxin